MKKAIRYTLALLLCITLTACVEVNDTSMVRENEALLAQVEALEASLADAEAQREAHEATLAALREELAAQQALAEAAGAQAAQAEALARENSELVAQNEALRGENTQLAEAVAAGTPAAGDSGTGAAGAAPADNNDTAALSGNTPEPAAEAPAAEAPVEEAAVETGGRMVWVPNSGQKYHSTSTCSNMKNPTETTEENAIARGYGKCSKCW